MRHTGIAAAAAFALAAALAASGGCGTRANPDFCCSDTSSCSNSGTDVGITVCTDPTRPLCDDLGDYGPPRTCVPDIGGECQSVAQCTNPDRPFCIDNRCVECEAGDASDRCDNPLPACDPDTYLCTQCTGPADCVGDPGGAACVDGACVGCAGPADCPVATEPVCDPTTDRCRGCQTDAECGTDGVCDREAGSCVAAAQILYVRAGATGTTCTAAAPCGSVRVALDRGLDPVTIKLAAGTYDEPDLVVAANRVVRLHGAGIDATTLRPTTNDRPVVDVTGGADLIVDGLTVANAVRAPAIDCDGNGSVATRRAHLRGSSGGGLLANTCSIDLVNTLITGNGSGTSTFGGVALVGLGTAQTVRFEFVTIANNTAPGANFGGVSCALLNTPVAIRSSVVWGNTGAGQIGGHPDCTATHTVVTGGFPGTGNTDLDPRLDPATFRLRDASSAIDRADPAATVGYDLDDQRRPAMKDSGADER